MGERGPRPLNGESVRVRHSISPDPQAWDRAVQIATANSMSVSQLFDMLVNEEWIKTAARAARGDKKARRELQET